MKTIEIQGRKACSVRTYDTELNTLTRIDFNSLLREHGAKACATALHHFYCHGSFTVEHIASFINEGISIHAAIGDMFAPNKETFVINYVLEKLNNHPHTHERIRGLCSKLAWIEYERACYILEAGLYPSCKKDIATKLFITNDLNSKTIVSEDLDGEYDLLFSRARRETQDACVKACESTLTIDL